MKKILTQYLWIFLTVFTLAVISISMLSKEKNPLEELEEKIKKVRNKRNGFNWKWEEIRTKSYWKGLGRSR